ncbi:methanogen homoisocitrate dehydrogenase [Methanohalophilus levihalophilus]|uniref:isocitrate/isopropylmalate dehydrogenase family protein n=1 Tax=Methanohalophilus levihalophilus TaxID=1431282 RepID=UPI001AE8D9EB|nr:isocitrate/isopropylmalate family dehydrogenase [Methanohalophilus levihalophilus]MBP2029972.1 methanogen homoisocitrate dehydrogenase [Methanohalophilus levihalophilus]
MKLAVIEGDGVGKEVIPAALQVLDCFPISFEKVPFEVGYGRWEKTGQAISDDDIELLRGCDCILFGAVTTPPDPNYKSVLLTIRKQLDLYANIRPIHPIKGIHGVNASSDFDILIVRENTEGMYSGIEEVGSEEAFTKRVVTKHGSARIAEVACKFAKKRNQKLTIVHKSNVLKSDTLFLDTCRQVANSMGVEHNDMLVDAMAYDMIRSPEKYGVVVATNLFGDILSDLGAALVGSLGLVPSANIGKNQAFFEPVHGSAPDIAGQGIANPIAAILSVKMLLNWMGEDEAAGKVEMAVEKAISNGVKTPDLGGKATTQELT